MSDSDIRDFCRRVYREHIAMLALPEELKRALKTNERVPGFIDNLAREISALPGKTSKETARQLVQDLTSWFCQSVKQVADEKHMSEVNRLMIKQKHDDFEAFKKTADALESLGEEVVTKEGEKETHLETCTIREGL